MPLLRSAAPASTGTISQAMVALAQGRLQRRRRRSAGPRGRRWRWRRRRRRPPRSASRARPRPRRPSPRGSSSSRGVVVLVAGEVQRLLGAPDRRRPRTGPRRRWAAGSGPGARPGGSRISSTTAAKSAPTRSILLTNASAARGTCRPGARPSRTAARRRTRRRTRPPRRRARAGERSTSIVKSTWPGVSIRWISCLLPLEGGGGGGDGDAALALLRHPVHLGLAVVDLADLVDACPT